MTEELPFPQRDFLEAVPVALVVVDENGHILATNAALRRLFGYAEQELEGSLVEVLIPDDLAAAHGELRSAYAQVPVRRAMGAGLAVEGVAKNGQRLSVEVRLDAIEIEGRRCVMAAVIDASGLRAEQDKTRMALDASASAMIMADAKGEIVLVNRQAVEVFGYREEDLIGKPVEVLLPDRFRRRHVVYRNSYAAESTARAMGGDRSLHGRRADGSEFPVEIGLTPIDDQGRSLVLATVIDATERVRAEEEIRRQNRDLRRLNRELGEFAYSASHDLKAPLATLEGLLLCLEDDLADGDLDNAGTVSTKAKGLTTRLSRLIEGILGFSLAESLDPRSGRVELHRLVETVGADLNELFAARGVELRNDVPPTIESYTDHRRVAEILENLLTNAAKFSDQRRDERFAAVGASCDDQGLTITVSDNGIGIPEDGRAQVFTMFRRFANHAEEGTGLGLAMVKQHVDRLNGDIEFDTGPEGTTFSIRLPLNETPQFRLDQTETATETASA